MTQDWREHANCLGVETDVFFPHINHRGPSNRLAYREALSICARCTVRSECLSLALTDSYFDGVWGGTTPTDRRKLRQGRRRLRVIPEPAAQVEGHPTAEALPRSVSAGIGIDVDVHDLTEPESTVTRDELLRFRSKVPWTA